MRLHCAKFRHRWLGVLAVGSATIENNVPIPILFRSVIDSEVFSKFRDQPRAMLPRRRALLRRLSAQARSLQGSLTSGGSSATITADYWKGIPMNAALRSLALAIALLAIEPPGFARDNGQWEATDAAVQAWFRALMQPDNPMVSCCGEADAYYADSFEVQGDEYVAIITDTREDAPLGRPHIPSGTKIVVPNNKLKFDRGNPTGHGVIFVSTTRNVLCYVVPGGV